MAKKNIDTTTMGGRIQVLRLQKGWSQEELGFRIGVNNKSVISFYEHDTRSVSVSVLQVLAKELGTSTDYLVNGTESGEKEADPDILMAIQLLKSLKTKKGKKAVLEHIKLVSMMEE
jgi:transcriptional regulator with XRE-family HTH domain